MFFWGLVLNDDFTHITLRMMIVQISLGMKVSLQGFWKAVLQNLNLLGVVPFFTSLSELFVRNLDYDTFGILVRNLFLGGDSLTQLTPWKLLFIGFLSIYLDIFEYKVKLLLVVLVTIVSTDLKKLLACIVKVFISFCHLAIFGDIWKCIFI